MRPNIDISYTLNGHLKDYAEQQDVTLQEAYIPTLGIPPPSVGGGCQRSSGLPLPKYQIDGSYFSNRPS
jgi:hypothetical protein